MMRKQLEEMKAQRMRIEIDLTKEPEYEFFNGDQVSKKMKDELKLYMPRSKVGKSKRPMTAVVSTPGNTRNARRFSETLGPMEFKGLQERKVDVIEDNGAFKIVRSPRKKIEGIPFDRFNEELTTIDPVASKAVSQKSNVSQASATRKAVGSLTKRDLDQL